MLSQRTILVVEDNLINRKMLAEILMPTYKVLEAENGKEALGVLAEYGERISLILLDIIMPVMDGYTFLSRVKASPEYASIPVIVTTQNDAESDEVAALSHGATDFVAKPYKPRVILHRVASIINLRETAAMINLIQYDRLTGMYSNEFFYQQARDALVRNPKKDYDVICSNIENFKLTNDVFGVRAGDNLLRDIAKLEMRTVGNNALFGRLNADQFVCMLEHRRTYTNEFFRDIIAQINELPNAKNLMVRWGIYEIRSRELSIEQICDRALLAARSIKGQYGKYFATYDDALRGKLLREQVITDGMESALKNSEFEIYLQPKYRISDDTLAGAEALVRWNHPRLGFQSPATFIPVFERNGFITKLDQYVWEKTCIILRQWDEQGLPPIPVSVNVSRSDIYNIDLPEMLTGLVDSYGIARSRLHLEITESAYTENPKQIISTVGSLRDLGFIIEMDDFGSGYSSLNMLNNLPIDVLKLDMNFIRSETAKPINQGILRFIINLARWMNLRVVAEGVETREQLERLRKIGCDYVQGYYFAKPMPCGSFASLLRQQPVSVDDDVSYRSGLKVCSGNITHADLAMEHNSLEGINSDDQMQVFKAFCQAWITYCDPEGALKLATENVCVMSGSEREIVCGKPQLSAFLRERVSMDFEPCSIAFNNVFEQSVCDNIREIGACLTLKSSSRIYDVNVFGVLTHTKDSWLIKSFYYAEVSDFRTMPASCVPVLSGTDGLDGDDYIAGGIIGYYLEPGFPLCFINSQMLKFLGYDTADEFSGDIDRMTISCVHPGDRDMVWHTINGQLENSDDYVVQYRMCKRSGECVYVHEMGRKLVIDGGRKIAVGVYIDITAHTQAHQALSRIYDSMPGGVLCFRFDDDFSVIDANDGVYKFIGYTREEFAAMGNKMSSVIYGPDLWPLPNSFRRQLACGDTVHNEIRLVCKDKTIKWISANAQLFKEQNGCQCFYCAFIDITEEKNLQEKAQQRYEREIASFVKTAGKQYIVQGRLNVTKNAMEKNTAALESDRIQQMCTYGQAVEKLSLMAVNERDGENLRQTLRREKVLEDFAKGKRDYTFDILCRQAGGRAFYCSANFQVYMNPNTHDVVLFFHLYDITEQKTRELLLKRIAELDYDVIIDVDIERDTYQRVSLNEGGGESVPPRGSFQKEIREASDKLVDDKSKDAYLCKLGYEYMKNRLRDNDSYSFIVETKDGGKNLRVKRFQVFYIGRDVGRVCVARSDVTDVVRREQRQNEQLGAALEAAQQASAAKSDFLSRMSHEIRTPMNAIIGMSEIAADSINDTKRMAECIDKIGVSSRCLLELINDILDMSRIASGKATLKKENIKMEDFLSKINSVCRAQAQQRNVLYECVTDPALGCCYTGDATKLRQVLINILGNAIKFTESGGKVTFSISVMGKSENCEQLRFMVSDTGIGIDGEFIKRVFEPFEQESTGATALYGGTGLGLAIAKSFVEMMGGTIQVRSAKNVGSEFAVNVSLETAGCGTHECGRLQRDGNGGTPEDDEKKPQYTFEGKRVLLVEDNKLNIEVAGMLLESKGFVVELAENGLRALEIFSGSPDGYYDAIVMDIRMPVMDGLTAAKSIRSIGSAYAKNIPIVAMTANAFDDDIEQSARVGMNAHLAKPIEPERLYATLYRYIYGAG